MRLPLSHVPTAARRPCLAWIFLLAGCSTPASPADQRGGGGASTVEPGGGLPGVGGAGGTGTGGTGGGGSDAGSCEILQNDLASMLEEVRKTIKAKSAFLGVRTPDCEFTGVSSATPSITREHAFRIGSVTKTFVSAAVLQLVREQKLSLDDTVATLLSAYPELSDITVRHLLQHTSGIFNYTDDADWVTAWLGNPERQWTPEELVSVGLAHEPYGAPGEVWAYSNTGYILLGLILEAVEDKPIAVVLRERIMTPAGLDATYYEGKEAALGTLAPGYSGIQNVTSAYSVSGAGSAGALVSTAADLVSYGHELYAGSLLLTEDERALLLASPQNAGGGVDYGLGVMIFSPSIALDTALGHPGSIPGYHTQLFHWPAQGVTLAAAVTSDVSVNDITVGALKVLAPVYFSP